MGCDPGKVLVIKTSGKPGVSVTLYANKSILLQNEGNKEKLVIHLPASGYPPKKDTIFLYGIGTWSKGFISGFSANIDSIIINNSSGKLVLSGKD